MARDVIRGLLDAVYPPICALCDSVAGGSPCAECVAEMPEGGELPPLPEIARVVTAYDYEGRARQAVWALKFERATDLAPFMADAVTRAAQICDYDLVVPVPVHAQRLRERGFDQAALLTRAFPRAVVAPTGTLRRTRMTARQFELDRSARLANVRGAFAATGAVQGKKVLLVDDVTTSGGTLIAVGETLKAAGAIRVEAALFSGVP